MFKNNFSYDHYDTNKRIKIPLNITRIGIPKATSSLHQLAQEIKNSINDNIEMDYLCAQITNGIYDACINSYSKKPMTDPKSTNFSRCNSQHFKVMATINLFTYNLLRDNNFKEDDYVKYLTDWQKYESMVTKAEDEELDIKCNVSWKNKCKTRWKKCGILLTRKERMKYIKTKKLDESVINRYFTDIFKSEKIISTPTIANILNRLENYELYIPILDDPPDMYELDMAMRSYDALSPKILIIIPNSLKDILSFLH